MGRGCISKHLLALQDFYHFKVTVQEIAVLVIISRQSMCGLNNMYVWSNKDIKIFWDKNLTGKPS